MDFSIKSLRTLKAENPQASKKICKIIHINTYLAREIKNNDRMSEIIRAVREVMQ